MNNYKLGIKLDFVQLNCKKNLLEYNFTNDTKNKAGLIWCRFKTKPEKLFLNQVKQLNVLNNKNLYFYLEREEEMYKTTLDEILKFIENLEPWVDIDAYIFDDSYKWVISYTHDDCWLSLGIR